MDKTQSELLNNSINTVTTLASNIFNSNNPNELIKYSFLIIGFLYFTQGWDLVNISIIVVVFLVLMLVIKTKLGPIQGLLAQSGPNLKDGFGLKNIIDTLLPGSSTKIESIINKTIPRLIPEFPNSPSYKNMQPLMDEFKDNVGELTNYMLALKEKFNDPSFLKLLTSMIILIKSYVSEVGKVVIGLEQQLYTSHPHLDFQNIQNIQKELFTELESVYFKIDVTDDDETHEILDAIKEVIKEMNTKLETLINEDFEQNTSSNKGPVQISSDPKAYNT